jgi:hypothetical protein
MRDQKLGYWLAIVPGVIPLPDLSELKTKALEQPVSAFVANAKQALALSNFPIGMWQTGQRFKLAEIAASILTFQGDPMPGIEGYMGRFPLQQCREVRQNYDSILNGTVIPPIDIHKGWLTITDLTTHVTDDLRDTYDTLMSSQLVLSWMAFETMSGDLWEAALNEHPGTLAMKASKNQSMPM